MVKVLITYYSKTGNTAQMAEIVAEAAAVGKAGGEAIVKEVVETSNDDLLAADAVAIGSPDYFSYVAGQVKILFDEALSIKSKLSGKPGACFASHGGGAKVKGPFEKLIAAVGLAPVAPCVLSHNAPAGKTVDELHSLASSLVEAAAG